MQQRNRFDGAEFGRAIAFVTRHQGKGEKEPWGDPLSSMMFVAALDQRCYDVDFKPSEVLSRLAMISPNPGGNFGSRDVALVAIGIGCSMTALIGPGLMVLGLKRSYVVQRRGLGLAPVVSPSQLNA